MKSNKSNLCARRRAFTLIELLTVIAIIAVLTAIIFPVFATAQENARRASCMSNMQQISTAVKQYKLDNRKYPDFLLTPAIKKFTGAAGEKEWNGTGCAVIDAPTDTTKNEKLIAAQGGDEACSLEKAGATRKLGGDVYASDGSGNYTLLGTGSLYPEYVKSLKTYKCPDDTWYDHTDETGYGVGAGALKDYPVTPPLARYTGTPKLDKTASPATVTNPQVAARFYKYDCYDANPVVAKDSTGTATNKIYAADGIWTLRYNRQWMPAIADNTGAITPTANKHFYDHQLVWTEPTDDSYLTMCSYHAINGKVTIVSLGGSAKVLDTHVLKDDNNNPVSALGTPTPIPTTTLAPTTYYVDFDPFRLLK